MPTGFADASARCGAVAGAALLCLLLAGHSAQGQIYEDVGAISLGGRGWSGGAPHKDPSKQGAANTLEFSMSFGAATDYIYRGTTLSDRKPAAGAAIEATWSQFYAGVSMATVKLPTQPSGEFTFGGGVRPTLGAFEFDFGVSYFHYPNEKQPAPTGTIDYWEAAARLDRRINETIRVAAGYAYSPNLSSTGAWSQYAAAGVGFDVPKRLLKDFPELSVSFTVGAGYSWFGNQSAAAGGFPLPDYLNWQAGVTFSRKAFNLDLRYFDTNLSKENCYVFTGDPNARPGGRPDPITNPQGLMSNWCSATFVAKVWFAFE